MWKKGLLAGLASLVVGMVFNQLFGLLFPSIKLEYMNPAIFRPWTDPLMMLFFLYPFVLSLVSFILWNLIHKQLGGKTPTEKAFRFANVYFLIATIPGMFVSYTSFQISFLMITSWTIMGYIEVFVAGWIFAR